jgi:hypothetical protein
MDKDTVDRYQQVVGNLKALEASARFATCMPCDVATEALLAVARMAIAQAVTSASRYATMCEHCKRMETAIGRCRHNMPADSCDTCFAVGG